MDSQSLFAGLQPLFDWLPWLNDYRWQLVVAAVLLATALISLIFNRVLRAIIRSLERTDPVWDDLLLDALNRPAVVLIWVLGMTLALQIGAPYIREISIDVPGSVRKFALILLLAWTLMRFVTRFERVVLLKRESIDLTTALAISKLLRLIIVVLTALTLMQSLGYSISGILAFGGVGGIAVGFAAKDLLANFFGGLMIYLDRPFKVGDWIRSPDKNIEGVVEQIGWRLTIIRTFDHRPLYIPNSTFASIAVENPSRMTHRRIFEYVGVRYDDAAVLPTIVAQIRELLTGHEEIDESKALFVHLNRFGPSSLDIMVYASTHTTDWGRSLSVKEDVMLRIMAIIEAAGAEIAFPTNTVHLAVDTAGQPEVAALARSAAQPVI